LRGVFRDLTLTRVASNENGSVCLSHGMGLWVMRLQLTTLVGKDWQRGKHTFFGRNVQSLDGYRRSDGG
jgi:hypothetical protein